MKKAILCAANVSEGRSKEDILRGYCDYYVLRMLPKLIEALASSITTVEGVSLIDVDPSPVANRTVYNFAGSPEAVLEAAFNLARAVSQLVDMTRHKGLQPRIGALDACPFVPVKNVSLEECVECAKMFASKLAEELSVPVYLYGAAAAPDREKTLQEIRMEEYESLAEKVQLSEWAPDYGPAEFVPQWGASMIGARKFLVCYNVNLLSTKEQATRIALNIREDGRGPEEPGRLKEVQAMGWYSEEHNVAQVTTTITDFEQTPLHVVYQEVLKDAEELNLGVVGSQIVGVVPLSALLITADYFIEKEKLFILEEDQKIRLVMERLGLNSLSAFNYKERVIEYILDGDDSTDGPLISMSMKDFILTVGSRTVTPGGGSVVGLQCAMGAALSTMTGLLAFGNRKFATVDDQMRKLLPPLYNATRDLIPHIDDDAVLKYDHARINAISPETPDEKTEKCEIEQRVLQRYVSVSLQMARDVSGLLPHVEQLANICGLEQRMDLQVGLKSLESGVWGAHYVMKDALNSVTDQEEVKKAEEEMKQLLDSGLEKIAQILKDLESRTSDVGSNAE